MTGPEHDTGAGQQQPRTVHIVPHTHWDRECSGGVSSRPNAGETWSAATHTNERLPSRRASSRGAEDWLRTGATRSQSDSSGDSPTVSVRLRQGDGLWTWQRYFPRSQRRLRQRSLA
jgi:hypothetical protein